VGLVAAVLISTLQKLLPRGRELHLHRLREEARKYGFIVERQAANERDPALARCVGYRLALNRCALEQEFSFRRNEHGWEKRHGADVDEEIESLLVQLPTSVAGIDRQSFSVLVHWIEPADIGAVEVLYASLKPLHQMPVGL